MTARIDRKSEAQANAEAIARRDAGFRDDHALSVVDRERRRDRPRGLASLLRWYEAEWQAQAPDDLHRFVVWFEYVAVQEVWRRCGGGSHLGSLAWSDGFRRLLEAPRSSDRDGFFVHPLAAAMVVIERRDAYMAAYLRAIALAGFDVAPLSKRAIRAGDTVYQPIPESVAYVYAEEALDRLWRAYRDEPPARTIHRPLTGQAQRVPSAPSDEARPPTEAGPTASASSRQAQPLAIAIPAG